MSRLLLMHQAGLIEYALRKARETANKNPCSRKTKDKNEQPIMLKLQEFVGAFLTLGGGSSTAVVVFLGEVVTKKST